MYIAFVSQNMKATVVFFEKSEQFTVLDSGMIE